LDPGSSGDWDCQAAARTKEHSALVQRQNLDPWKGLDCYLGGSGREGTGGKNVSRCETTLINSAAEKVEKKRGRSERGHHTRKRALIHMEFREDSYLISTLWKAKFPEKGAWVKTQGKRQWPRSPTCPKEKFVAPPERKRSASGDSGLQGGGDITKRQRAQKGG